MTDTFGNGCSECLLLPVGRAALGAHERAEDIGCHRFQVVENHLHHLSRSQHRLISFLSGCHSGSSLHFRRGCTAIGFPILKALLCNCVCTSQGITAHSCRIVCHGRHRISVHCRFEVTEIAWGESHPIAIVIALFFSLIKCPNIVIRRRLQVFKIAFQRAIVHGRVCLVGLQRLGGIILFPLEAEARFVVAQVSRGRHDGASAGDTFRLLYGEFGIKGTISLNHVCFIAIGISYCNLQIMLCINCQSRGFIFVVSDTWDFYIINVYLR